MTNIRKTAIKYHGLEINMDTDDKRSFFLTEDEPLFKVQIKNPGTKRRRGKIAIIWKLENVSTTQIINIDIDPGKTQTKVLNKEWLYTEGIARYDLRSLELPEEYLELSDYMFERLVKNVHDIDPLCSYYIRDKGMYEYEQAEHDRILKSEETLISSLDKLCESSKNIEKLNIWVICLTVILTILTILLAKQDIMNIYKIGVELIRNFFRL